MVHRDTVDREANVAGRNAQPGHRRHQALGAIAGGLVGSTIGIRPTLVMAAGGGALSILWLVGSPLLQVRAVTDLDAIDPHTGLPQPAATSDRTATTGWHDDQIALTSSQNWET
jgi:hypothetical protein